MTRSSFNTQPPEGGWVWREEESLNPKVSTHSRPKAAGRVTNTGSAVIGVSTHSRPKAAGLCEWSCKGNGCVSTHSRPKAAGALSTIGYVVVLFQHTAARRRLVLLMSLTLFPVCFNTQPPEGGWI